MKNIFWAAVFTAVSGIVFTNAQISVRTPIPPEKSGRQYVYENADTGKSAYNLEGALNPDDRNLRNLRPLRGRRILLTKRDKEQISVDAADKNRYSRFLDEAETGIFRIHDTANCKISGKLINADEPCPWNVVGKATLYSFRTEDYAPRALSDIEFSDGALKIAGLNLLGFLTALGDVPLENLSLQSGGIKEMAEFQPSTALGEIKKQFAITQKGFNVDDYVYKTELKIKPDQSYALRLIAYDSKVFWKIGRRKVNLLAGDKRKDVVAVFRVIRLKEDGSVNILWKKLQIKDAPKIAAK